MRDILDTIAIIGVVTIGVPWAAWTLIFRDMIKDWRNWNEKK